MFFHLYYLLTGRKKNHALTSSSHLAKRKRQPPSSLRQTLRTGPSSSPHASNRAAGLVFPRPEHALIRHPHAALRISEPRPARIASPELLRLPPRWPSPHSHCSRGGIRHRAGTGEFLATLSRADPCHFCTRYFPMAWNDHNEIRALTASEGLRDWAPASTPNSLLSATLLQ